VSSDRGQAVVELALGLPIVLLATFYSFGVIDAAATQQGVEAGARRAAIALAGSNEDAQARGAVARTSWLLGQDAGVTIVPDETQLRCKGTTVTITVSAPGHLAFLLPVATTWVSIQRGVIENPGPQRPSCPP
jgi:Flp pilus assembly protein TadG